MRKYLLHVLIISFVFLLAVTVSYAGEVETYKQEVKKNPDDAVAHYNLGVAYGELGKHKKAIKSYKHAIRIDPDPKDAVSIGSCYGELGMYQEGIESYKQAIRIDPDYALAYYGLGHAYLGLNDRGSAMEQYKILKELDTELANKLFNLIYK